MKVCNNIKVNGYIKESLLGRPIEVNDILDVDVLKCKDHNEEEGEMKRSGEGKENMKAFFYHFWSDLALREFKQWCGWSEITFDGGIQ